MAEFHNAYVHVPVYTAYQWLQYEVCEPCLDGCALHGVLQLPKGSQEPSRDCCNAGRIDGAYLDVRGACGDHRRSRTREDTTRPVQEKISLMVCGGKEPSKRAATGIALQPGCVRP